MPADINTFNMLERGVLEHMTQPELLHEVERVRVMEAAVNDYLQMVLSILRQGAQ